MRSLVTVAVATLKYISEDEYIDTEEQSPVKREWLSGQVFDMAGGFPDHALIIANVTGELRNAARDSNCAVYSADLRIRVQSSGLNTYPGVSVICGGIRTTERHPVAAINPSILVEVLSPSTREYDRGEKWRHYQTIETLIDYLLVWQERPRIERFSRMEGGKWEYELFEGLDASVSLPGFNGELPLTEVYRDVEFPPNPQPRIEYPDDWSQNGSA